MIFVSYSRRDKTQCDEIVRTLEGKGFKVWQDTKNIRGGDKWRADVERGIRDADIFVVLLSPSRSVNAQKELEFADKYKKKIIGVRLKPQKKLPEGYEIILSGSHQIDMADGFAMGLERLFEALGPAECDQPTGPTGLWRRTVRKAQRLRAVVVNSNLGPAVLKYGAAAIAGAATVAVAVAKKNEQQRDAAAKVNEQQRTAALKKYRDAIDKIMEQYFCEVGRSFKMTADAYSREVRPRVQRLLGVLEGMEVPMEGLKEKHRELLDNLQRTVAEHDDAFMKLEGRDIDSCKRAIDRFLEALAGTLQDFRTNLRASVS
jgi:hypothetical protein